jgi:hypothetical protein
MTDEMKGRRVWQNSTLSELGCDLPTATPGGSDDDNIHGGHAIDFVPSLRHRSCQGSNLEEEHLHRVCGVGLEHLG